MHEPLRQSLRSSSLQPLLRLLLRPLQQPQHPPRQTRRPGLDGARHLAAVIGLMLATVGCQPHDAGAERQRIGAVLDDFHTAAADADRERYLAHFAPDGVFMGTDDWERWPLEEFSAYVAERFSSGSGWSYTSEDRHITFAPDGDTAWFDEIMVSQRWGRFRGTGVLRQIDGDWKLAHYSLTALVPNEHFEAVSEITTSGFENRNAVPDA